MRITILTSLVIIGALSLSTSAVSQSFDFQSIKGKWTIVNSASKRSDLGRSVAFLPAFPNGQAYDAAFPFFEGLSALTLSDGYKGSHVKVVSQSDERCWYYVAIISRKKMTWRLRDKTSPKCLESMVLELRN